MSTRQTQINKFTDGINTDLHPLTAPDNLLSDCVNGTVITYNGNEYILQNDMGNYQLKNANLPVNHIPIGIKEYGGIIYIVSHNPVDNITEVGCYPSPKTLAEADQDEISGEDYGLITLSSLFTDYSALVGRTSLKLYSTDEDFKLYPGDKYYIHYDQDNNKEYQTLEFYVVGEDKSSYKLEDKDIEYSKTKYDGDPKSLNTVKWETPGWLAYKYRIANLDTFNLQLTNVSVPPFITGTDPVTINFSLKGQVLTSDVLYNNPTLRNKLHLWVTAGTFDSSGNKHYLYTQLNSLTESLENEGEGIIDNGTTTGPVVDYPVLGILKKDYKGEDKLVQGNLLSINSVNYTGLNRFLYTQKVASSKLSCLNLKTTNNKQQFFIEAVPIIVGADKKDGAKQHIIYDNLEQTTTINLETLNKADDLEALSYFKYTVDNDEIILNFDIVSSSSVMDGVTTTINIYAPQKEENSDNIEIGKPIKSINLNNVSYVGQNMVTIPFTGKFEKEGAYILELLVKWGNQTELESKTWYKTLMATEVMNLFYDSYEDFSLIPLSEIVKKAEIFYQSSDVIISTLESNYTYINNDSPYASYNFEPSEEWRKQYNVQLPNNNVYDNTFDLMGGIQNDITLDIQLDAPKELQQGIWENMQTQQSGYINYNDGNSTKTAEYLPEGTSVSIQATSTLNTTSELREAYTYSRIYLADGTNLLTTEKRKKKLTRNDGNPDWFERVYSNDDSLNGNNYDDVFEPNINARIRKFNMDYVNLDDNYSSRSHKAILDGGSAELFIPTDDEIKTQGIETTKKVKTSAVLDEDDFAISKKNNESMQIVRIQIPWKPTIHSEDEGRVRFSKGPFVFTNRRWKDTPLMYAGLNFLWLDGEGEKHWGVDLDLPAQMTNMTSHIISDYRNMPFTYYECIGDSESCAWNSELQLHYKPDPWKSAGVTSRPSPDPLLILSEGQGVYYNSASPTNRTPSRLPGEYSKAYESFGAFFPMYSGKVSYTKEANTDYPTIDPDSKAPSWIICLTAIRIRIKYEGSETWALIPLDTTRCRLWTDQSNNYLNPEDDGAFILGGTPDGTSLMSIPRIDIVGADGKVVPTRKGFYTDEYPGWRNDSQTSLHIDEIMNRAAFLACHLYAIADARKDNVSIVKSSEAISNRVPHNPVLENINISKIVSSHYIWGHDVTKSSPVLSNSGRTIPLINNNLTYKGTSVININKTLSQPLAVDNISNWEVNVHNQTYGIEDIKRSIVQFKEEIKIKVQEWEKLHTEERKEGSIYHDLDECGIKEQALYDCLNKWASGDTNSVNKLGYDADEKVFKVNLSQKSGQLFNLKAQGVWLPFTVTETQSKQYEGAVNASTKTMHQVLANLCLPNISKETKVVDTLSPYFADYDQHS